MGNKVSQRAIAHHGITLPSTQVTTAAGQAVIAEAMRVRRSTGWMVADIVEDWYQQVYLPSQKK